MGPAVRAMRFACGSGFRVQGLARHAFCMRFRVQGWGFGAPRVVHAVWAGQSWTGIQVTHGIPGVPVTMMLGNARVVLQRLASPRVPATGLMLSLKDSKS